MKHTTINNNNDNARRASNARELALLLEVRLVLLTSGQVIVGQEELVQSRAASERLEPARQPLINIRR